MAFLVASSSVHGVFLYCAAMKQTSLSSSCTSVDGGEMWRSAPILLRHGVHFKIEGTNHHILLHAALPSTLPCIQPPSLTSTHARIFPRSAFPWQCRKLSIQTNVVPGIREYLCRHSNALTFETVAMSSCVLWLYLSTRPRCCRTALQAVHIVHNSRASQTVCTQHY